VPIDPAPPAFSVAKRATTRHGLAMAQSPATPPARRRVFLIGATGTIGKATAAAFARRGFDITCFVRPRGGGTDAAQLSGLPGGVQVRFGDVTDAGSIARDGFCGARYDTLVSCLASRTGAPCDAWAIDHDAQLAALSAARAAGVGHFVLLSAICVQKPQLAFQRAKLAFEQALILSGLPYTIIRPTAFFKSLSGQVDRVRRGKPWLMFGDGMLTACKPISDRDLADYIVDCVGDDDRRNRILPVGGPGEAMTPLEQGEALFGLLGRDSRYRRVPVALLDAIIGALGTLGHFVPSLRDKAEFARIGRYYATESMLTWDAALGRYDAAATPSTGSDTLFDHYARLLRGEVVAERGDHAVF